MELLQLAQAEGEQDVGSVIVTARSIRCSWIGAMLTASRGGMSPGMKQLSKRQANYQASGIVSSNLVFGLVQLAMSS
jgi:hypothetical protein